ncbi:MAG: class I SAM-dependent methyltransferase [Roseburia sp. 1XD42-69]
MKIFNCIICKGEDYTKTGKHPRERQSLDIVKCKQCGHIQLFPLLSEEELEKEYAEDRCVRNGVANEDGKTDFEKMRIKFSEWTRQHVDMYWDKLQKHTTVLELASGYGFFAELCNKRKDKRFIIEGVEIGEYRLKNYGGGVVYNIDFMKESVPPNMIAKYDFIICMHLLEHLTDPVKYLVNIKPLLAENGEVLFEVPNLYCFLAEISPEYEEFTYAYAHVSYYYEDTLRLVFEKAGYNIKKIYTKEIYSIENHIRWVREGKPFVKYNQMFMPDERLEFINEYYKKKIAESGKGYSLIIEANLQK